MSEVVVDERFHQLMRQHSLTEVARILEKRYSSVRDAAVKAGYTVRRGRPSASRRQLRYRRQVEARLATGDDPSVIAREMRIPLEDVLQIRETPTEPSPQALPQAEPPGPEPTSDPS